MKHFNFILSIHVAFAVVDAIALPAITTHPTGQSVSLGAKIAFQVGATGSNPLSYQWRLSSIDIPGAINNSLVLTNIQLPNHGDYVVVVTDASGSVTSRVATLQVDPAFTKITAGPIATEGGKSTACAWGDYDNDGWLDLFVNNRDQRNFLYRNKGGGLFEKITQGHMVTDSGTHLAGVWGDYDNDGALDLLVVNGGCCAPSQKNLLYHNDGLGSFTLPSAAAMGAILSDAGGFHGAAWGDYDGDGFLDAFVANYTGSNRLFRNNGGTNFVGTATFGSDSAEAAWADYDNDGDLDLVILQHKNPSGKNLLFQNDGRGLLTRVNTGSLVLEGANSAGCTWGDFDNDGFFDLFVSNINLERNFFYRNKGDGALDKITNRPPVNESADSYGAAWGDYDNDGFLDLFVANGAFGNGPLNNSLFRNKGDGTFEKISTGSLGNDQGHSFGCAWADYDNDGFLDLFVANDPSFDSAAIPESNFLYRNNGNSNRWLTVRLVGSVSNRAGIGAKVRVKARIRGQARWQLRQIASSDGRTGGSLEAHFGLGNATNIDTLRIEWSSGIVQELSAVAPGQFLTVTEPPRLELHVAQATGLVNLKVKSWKGFAYDFETSNDLKAWTHLATLTNETGTVSFADPLAREAAQRFYRVVIR